MFQTGLSMPINIPNDLPAASILTAEQIFVMTQERASHQDIRPLELLFLNLMPKKIDTEIQYMRRLSNTPLQVNIDLMRIDHHESRNTPMAHLNAFYRDFEDIRERFYDGMIITGAPLDKVQFDEVTYIHRLREIIAWSREHVTSTLFSCWGVSVALNVFYDLPLMQTDHKLSGVFMHNTASTSDPLTRGFDDRFLAPHSRFLDFPTRVIQANTDLQVLADSPRTGVFLAVSPDRRQVYVTGHPEYDATTLADEYRRDVEAGRNPAIPENYFPGDDVTAAPSCVWRSHSALLFGNFLNYYVYQQTPFKLRSHDGG